MPLHSLTNKALPSKRRSVAPHCIIVYQIAGDEHLDSGAAILIDLAKRLFPNMLPSLIVVDQNKSFSPGLVSTGFLRNHECHYLGGDNSLREFTGYDIGIRFVNTLNHSKKGNPVVMIANETFHRHYGNEYLGDFTSELAHQVIEQNTLMGHMDAYHQPCQVLGHTVQTWIRSSLIILQYRTLLKLYPFSIRVNDEQIFSDDHYKFFSDTDKLSDNYKNFLRRWLLGIDIEDQHYTHTWHSVDKPSRENIEQLRLKAKSIFCEHLFSARAIQKGYRLTITNRDEALKKLHKCPGDWALGISGVTHR